MPIRLRNLLLLLLTGAAPVAAQLHGIPPPKYEVRAVWVTTTAGLDWPKTTDKQKQQQSLREIVRSLKAGHMNTIYFQARARGDAYYHSAYEPWAENLTGTLGKDPGWDPLEFLIAEAHAAGIEVHAWFNVFKVRGPLNAASSVPLHVTRAHPEWTVNHGGEGWLDPGIPDVRSYTVKVAVDLVMRYNLDGINFDFLRYPGRDFPDADTYRRYGNGTPRDQWRRSNVDKFMTQCYDRLIAVKPTIKVGAAPLGLYASGEGPWSGAVREFSQDARGWFKRGKLDYAAPQIYWDIGASKGNPDFVALVRDWQRTSSGRHIYVGIGAYKPEVAREIPAQIDSARTLGAAGESYFRYENIRGMNLFNSRYETPALIPPMPWKDSLPTPPPGFVGVTELAANIFQIEWVTPPPAKDGDRPVRYVVYRSLSPAIPFDDPNAIACITPDARTSFIDTVTVPAGPTYFYAVTALDKMNNESRSSPVTSGTSKEFLSLKGKLSETTALSASFANGGDFPALVAYSLARTTDVTLTLVARRSGLADSIAATLAHGIQEEGTHVIGVRNIPRGAGRYFVRLRAGDSVVEQQFDIGRNKE